MRHPDPDDLALFAVSSGADLHDHVELAAHVDDCPVCHADVEAYRYIAELVHHDGAGADLEAPGPHVWAAIADELGFDRPVAPTPRLTAVPDEPPAPAGAPTADDGAPAPAPVDLGARRRSRWFTAAAALVVGSALGAGAMAITQKTDDPDPARVEATAPLDPVPGGPLVDPDPTLGSAQLVSVDTGQWVVVDTEELPAITGSYEVWLFGDDGRMVALGSLQAGKGQFSVPAGIDTREYRTVDVSDEPDDGNPAHSGVSVVRGTFS